MANALYSTSRNAFLTAQINWLTDSIRAALISSSYSPNLSLDQYWIEVSSFIVGSPVTLTSKTAVDGVANANSVVFNAVSGSQIRYIVIYQDTGDPNTSKLIACIDNATGFPVVPNGGSIGISWDTSNNKIFKL